MAHSQAAAQANLHGIRSVARAWESRTVAATHGGASASLRAPRPTDLDFIGPPRVARSRAVAGDPSTHPVDFELHAEGVGPAIFEGARGEVTMPRVRF